MAICLAVLFAAEAVMLVGAPGELSAWQLPFVAAVGAAAVAAPRHPVGIAAATAGLLMAETGIAVAYGAPGPRLFGGIAVTEMAGTWVTMLVCVRCASRRLVIPATVGLAGVVLLGSNLRPVFEAISDAGDEFELQPMLLLGIAAAIGLYLRQRDHVRARDVQTLVDNARQSERLALARELHDLVAYHLTGILVQAKAADRASEPDTAQRVLPEIVSAGSEAMGAMRRLVQTLRYVDPQRTIEEAQYSGDLDADLRALAEGSPLPVQVTVEVPVELPADVAGSVLRVIRESLTNVGKHAQAPTRVDVEVTATERRIALAVRDNGDRSATAAEPGYGLVGLRERVTLLGGTLRAGPVGKGWQVRADIPLDGRTGSGGR